MLDSIYIGMSGLTAHSKGLQTISNNVANLNTPGFKTTTPRFSDLYYGQRFFGQGPDSARVASGGSGVEYDYGALNFKQGEIRRSDGQLDLGIDGPGFLALLQDGKVRYARTGQFVIDDDGIVREKGSKMELTTLGADGKLANILIDKLRASSAKPTATVKIEGNLQTNVNPNQPGGGTGTNPPATAETFSIANVEMYDASGTKIVTTVKITRDLISPPLGNNSARWQVALIDKDNKTIGQGEIRFINSIIEPGADKVAIRVTSGTGMTSEVTLDFANIGYVFGPTVNSNLKVAKTDGYGPGTMSGLRVDDAGALVIDYSNGQKETLGKIAMADFADPQRLVQLGDGVFDASQLPEPAYVASKQGAGTLSSGAIEASNVDLSTEFGRLILIQRGFQASSQVISTANEMIMQLFQMKSGQG
ncbi:flagellar hook-basal body complex protein [Lysobacter enzymogenes]|uniref:Flagellar hook protein FlgE n=1 Tax=Lysobacter enzymogenes TaxID=69 RepID=A0A3N2RK50_LYSEN|nr:flagellar hook-basal body complex protein [Lysobacter enzymogenes]QTJ24559.1 FlgE [Lysobacter enzymogenes]ROU07779.1 flagellar hook-basal body complex protein [Lysobacter enzymogenes]